MFEDEFPKRLSKLRADNGASARDMSLSIGQNQTYIHSIEAGRHLPSMSGFFYICEFLNISPRDFFDYETKAPDSICDITERIRELDRKQMELLDQIDHDIKNKKKRR